jgi:dihydrofolate reductase
MIVSLIAALDELGGIGWQGELPWRLSADQKRFKRITMGHHLIMGRKTYESIGQPLPGRFSIIITRQEDYQPPGCPPSDLPPACAVVHSLETALELACQRGETEVFIIGGAEIYQAGLPRAGRLYLTTVHTRDAPADVFFPTFDPNQWQERQYFFHPPDEKNEYGFTFRILERILPAEGG